MRAALKSLLYRPIQLVILGFGVVLLVGFGVRAGAGWRDHQRMQAVRASVEQVRGIQQEGLHLQRLLLDDITGMSPVDRGKLRDAALQARGLVASASDPDGAVPALREVERVLESDLPPRLALTSALELLRQASLAQTRNQGELLDQIEGDARAEAQAETAALLGLLALLLISLWLLRQRILNPIDNLRELLSRLANGEFAPVQTQSVDPLLLPLFGNYNQMVSRLQELEQAHRSHADSLQSEVSAATRALLQQHQDLARTERLAAMGEVAANLAHELRNPLAAILLTLANLRHDATDADLVTRLDLVIGELERVTRLLNEHLAMARHGPEPAARVVVAELVRDLLALIHYQASSRISFENHVPQELRCRLPEGRLRQALLNLLLNAVQALDGHAGKISVDARMADDELALAIEDDGPGFDARFLRGEVRPFVSGHESGTGLGLAMVRRFARDMGGRLLLENREPHGARVTLILPSHD